MGIIFNGIKIGQSQVKIIYNPPSILPPDPDAAAFLTAVGITDVTISSAIDTLVKDLKAAGIWSRAIALYPFVGGTASTHKWNLKDPQDLDTAYRLTFFGGITHSANGVLPGGITSYARTYLNFNTTIFPEESSNLSYYSRTNILESASNGSALGALGGSPTWGNYLLIGNNNATLGPISAYRAQFASSVGFRHDAGTSPVYSGFFQGNIITNTTKVYRNNAQIDNTTLVLSNRAMINLECFLFCYNQNGSANIRTAKESAWAGITLGLTDTQILDYNTAIQTFQTTLGRNV
jgi:hypothetical protein